MLQLNGSQAQAVKEQGVNVHSSEPTMSSLDIAQFAGRNHKELLRDIRKMEKDWVVFNQRKFALVDYIDAKGEKRPMFLLTKMECLYIMAKFDNKIRAKLVLRWAELETKERNDHQPTSQNDWSLYAQFCRSINLSTDSGAYWKRPQRYPNEFRYDEDGRLLISTTLMAHLKKTAELRAEHKQIAARNPKYIGAAQENRQLSLFDNEERISLLALAIQIEDTAHRMSIVNKLIGGQ